MTTPYMRGLKDGGCADLKQNARLDELEKLTEAQSEKISNLEERLSSLIDAIEPIYDLNGEVSFNAINKQYGAENGN